MVFFLMSCGIELLVLLEAFAKFTEGAVQSVAVYRYQCGFQNCTFVRFLLQQEVGKF